VVYLLESAFGKGGSDGWGWRGRLGREMGGLRRSWGNVSDNFVLGAGRVKGWECGVLGGG